MWVTNDGTDSTVTELDASDGSFVRTISAGEEPEGSHLTVPEVWVANFYDATVSELGASDLSLVQTIPIGAVPDGISAAPYR